MLPFMKRVQPISERGYWSMFHNYSFKFLPYKEGTLVSSFISLCVCLRERGLKNAKLDEMWRLESITPKRFE